jgi:hypothetical protein
MGFMGKRLVGVANIPLEKYCKKVLKYYNETSDAFKIMRGGKDKKILLPR